MVTRCEISGLLRKCGKPGIAICQYCGRSFCGQHGDQLNDGQEICSERRCQQKRVDLALHFEFRDAAAARNAEGRCGVEGCEETPRNQCSKCGSLFGERHVTERDFELRDGTPSRGSVCDHCHKRRKLWSRR